MGGLIHDLDGSKSGGYAKNKVWPLGIAYGEDLHYKGLVNYVIIIHYWRGVISTRI